MKRLAVPARRGERHLESIQVEKHGDHLMLRERLITGEVFVLPIADETARQLAHAILSATDRVLIARS